MRKRQIHIIHLKDFLSINVASSLQCRFGEINGADRIRTHDLPTCVIDAGALPSLQGFRFLGPPSSANLVAVTSMGQEQFQHTSWESNPATLKAQSSSEAASHGLSLQSLATATR